MNQYLSQLRNAHTTQRRKTSLTRTEASVLKESISQVLMGVIVIFSYTCSRCNTKQGISISTSIKILSIYNSLSGVLLLW